MSGVIANAVQCIEKVSNDPSTAVVPYIGILTGPHQGLVVGEGAAQHLEEAEEHGAVDPVAHRPRRHAPAAADLFRQHKREKSITMEPLRKASARRKLCQILILVWGHATFKRNERDSALIV